MKAVELLKQDHKTLQALFKRFAVSKRGDAREQIAKQTYRQLDIHSKLEEEIFYPAVKEHTGKSGAALVREAIEEHAVAKKLIDELKSLSADDEQFEAKYTVLAESVKHHIAEEEGEMFPAAKKRLGQAALIELGRQMFERQEDLQATLLEKAVGVAEAFLGIAPTRRSQANRRGMTRKAEHLRPAAPSA